MTKTDRVWHHFNKAFDRADEAFKSADQAFDEAETLFASLPKGEHIRSETKLATEHTLRFSADSFWDRFKLAKKFFNIGFSLVFSGTGSLRFRKRK